MAYQNYFQMADDLIIHLNTIIGAVPDAFIVSRYTGLVAVAATTVYELAIKEIFISFSEKKHKVFGSFTGKYFERLNGRIKTRELKENHIPRFGDRYIRRYQKLIEAAEKDYLTKQKISISSSYNNVIEWRHQFVHEGKLPSTATYQEIIRAYEAGKEVVHCVYKAMQR